MSVASLSGACSGGGRGFYEVPRGLQSKPILPSQKLIPITLSTLGTGEPKSAKTHCASGGETVALNSKSFSKKTAEDPSLFRPSTAVR